MQNKTVVIAGGDLRYGYTAAALSDKFETYAVGFTRQYVPPQVKLVDAPEDLPMCDVLVLPMPVSDDGILVNAPFSQIQMPLPAFVPKLKPDAIVLGGKFGKSQAFFDANGIETADYLTSEDFAVRNAVPTAEGAIQIMLEEMPCTIYGSKVLILGFGRIGSRMAQTLHAMGAEVTVAARDVVKRTQAEMLGCRSMPFTELEAAAGKFDVICNTVPAKVVTESVLKKIQKDALILDLASKPGGINLEAAQKIGRRVIWALSLPGKTAPVTAGEIIAKTILHILEERRIADA